MPDGGYCRLCGCVGEVETEGCVSLCLSSREGVIAKKHYRCDFCGEIIEVGTRHDTRSGVGDGFWTMRMHPECHRYEQTSEVGKQLHDWDWYDDVSEPAFERSEVHLAEERQLNPPSSPSTRAENKI